MIILDLSYFYLWIVAPTCEKFSKEIAMTIRAVYGKIFKTKTNKQKNKKATTKQNKTKKGLSGFHQTLLVEPAWPAVDYLKFTLIFEN